MTAVSKPPLPPADIQPPVAAPTELKSRSSQSDLTGRSDGTPTPNFLRRWNVILLALVAAFAVVGSISSFIMRSASQTTADNTVPALIGVQDILASVAEANTAATAEFLSTRTLGADDRVNRNLYEDAIQRASQQTEEVSAIIGSDPQAHEALKDIGVSLIVYSGDIEAARLANGGADPGAPIRVVQQDVSVAVETITDRSQDQLNDERNAGRILTWVAIALGILTILALALVQLGLLRRTNRIFNPLLVLASILVLIVLGTLVAGPLSRTQALDDASEGGYEAIVTMSSIQTQVFNQQSSLSLRLLSQDGSGSVDPLDSDEMDSIGESIDLLLIRADAPREEAAAQALQTRWIRYQDITEQNTAKADSGNLDGATDQFQSEGLSSFNGVNTAIESALSDNRTQFTSGASVAASAVNTTPLFTIILPVLAALAIMLAIQRRLGEYR